MHAVLKREEIQSRHMKLDSLMTWNLWYVYLCLDLWTTKGAFCYLIFIIELDAFCKGCVALHSICEYEEIGDLHTPFLRKTQPVCSRWQPIRNKENKHAGSNSVRNHLVLKPEGHVPGIWTLLSVYPHPVCVAPTLNIFAICYFLIFLICRKIWRQAWRVGVCSRIGSNTKYRWLHHWNKDQDESVNYSWRHWQSDTPSQNDLHLTCVYMGLWGQLKLLIIVILCLHRSIDVLVNTAPCDFNTRCFLKHGYFDIFPEIQLL